MTSGTKWGLAIVAVAVLAWYLWRSSSVAVGSSVGSGAGPGGTQVGGGTSPGGASTGGGVVTSQPVVFTSDGPLTDNGATLPTGPSANQLPSSNPIAKRAIQLNTKSYTNLVKGLANPAASATAKLILQGPPATSSTGTPTPTGNTGSGLTTLHLPSSNTAAATHAALLNKV